MKIMLRVLLMGIAVLGAGAVNNLAAQGKAKDKDEPTVVVLKGAALGGVKFTHDKHEDLAKCIACHHASKPEKALKSAHEKCTDCHTKPAVAPMKTTIRDAYHDVTAKKGVCMDCHVKEAAAGKKNVPLKCNECHKKENI